MKIAQSCLSYQNHYDPMNEHNYCYDEAVRQLQRSVGVEDFSLPEKRQRHRRENTYVTCHLPQS